MREHQLGLAGSEEATSLACVLSRSNLKTQYICTRPGHVKLPPKFSLGPARLSRLVESETIKMFRIWSSICGLWVETATLVPAGTVIPFEHS